MVARNGQFILVEFPPNTQIFPLLGMALLAVPFLWCVHSTGGSRGATPGLNLIRGRNLCALALVRFAEQSYILRGLVLRNLEDGKPRSLAGLLAKIMRFQEL